ncbi:MAG: hypothetical protein HC828_03660 [Blastochloris sp.]|nr:hypothetical protein [Blastochloris sp.]
MDTPSTRAATPQPGTRFWRAVAADIAAGLNDVTIAARQGCAREDVAHIRAVMRETTPRRIRRTPPSSTPVQPPKQPKPAKPKKPQKNIPLRCAKCNRDDFTKPQGLVSHERWCTGPGRATAHAAPQPPHIPNPRPEAPPPARTLPPADPEPAPAPRPLPPAVLLLDARLAQVQALIATADPRLAVTLRRRWLELRYQRFWLVRKVAA